MVSRAANSLTSPGLYTARRRAPLLPSSAALPGSAWIAQRFLPVRARAPHRLPSCFFCLHCIAMPHCLWGLRPLSGGVGYSAISVVSESLRPIVYRFPFCIRACLEAARTTLRPRNPKFLHWTSLKCATTHRPVRAQCHRISLLVGFVGTARSLLRGGCGFCTALPDSAGLSPLSSLSATGVTELIIRRSVVRVHAPPPIFSIACTTPSSSTGSWLSFGPSPGLRQATLLMESSEPGD